MGKKPYLCHITDNGGNYSQVILDGIVEVKKFLRNNGVRFGNDDLSFLEDNSVTYSNQLKTQTFEVELLFVPSSIEVNNKEFIPISLYCKKYSHCRQAVATAIRDGKIDTVKHDGYCRYIEDKDFKKYERKQHNI